MDRVVKTEEIEAAETLADLAHLAMRRTHSADKCCTKYKAKRDTSRFNRESPIPDSDPPRSPLRPGVISFVILI